MRGRGKLRLCYQVDEPKRIGQCICCVVRAYTADEGCQASHAAGGCPDGQQTAGCCLLCLARECTAAAVCPADCSPADAEISASLSGDHCCYLMISFLLCWSGCEVARPYKTGIGANKCLTHKLHLACTAKRLWRICTDAQPVSVHAQS